MNLEEALQQNTPFKSEREKLAVNILFTASWLNIHQTRFFKGFDLTVQQYNILRILRGQKGQPIGVNSLADRMIDKSSNSSRLVEKLRTKGYLNRKVCPNDRRQAEVKITVKGEELLKTIDQELPSFFTLFGELSESEMQQLNNLLDKSRITNNNE